MDKKKKEDGTEEEDTFVESVIIGAVTDSAVLGAVLGGDVLGGMVGEALGGGSSED